MSMLKPATNKMAYAKVGLYGNAGSGKTYTAALIAIGLHQASKLTKPVGMFDTEPAAAWIIPLFEKANIPFLVYDESRALQDLMKFMDDAEKECSVVIIDSITHVWRDAQESYLSKVNKGLKSRGKKEIASLEFHHWRPIKQAWADFTDRFLSSKMHVIVCGRAGNVYEYQDKNDGSGKKELITTGTKMATEKELGYEPSLLIEMIADRHDGKIVNVALIQKDRSAKLNGAEIRSPNYQKLKPHFEMLNIGGEHFGSMDARNSEDMYPESGESDWDSERRDRTIWSEEIKGLMLKLYPSRSAEDTKGKQDMLEKYFHTTSWTKIEEATHSDKLKDGYHRMRTDMEMEAINNKDKEVA